MPNGHLPVSYEVLIEQIVVSADLLERLRAEPASPKMAAFIEQVEEARGRMFAALAACEAGRLGAPVR